VQIVASPGSMLCFLFIVRLGDLLIVRLSHLRWYALHTKNFEVHIIAVF
jgi:hypothetical protein